MGSPQRILATPLTKRFAATLSLFLCRSSSSFWLITFITILKSFSRFLRIWARSDRSFSPLINLICSSIYSRISSKLLITCPQLSCFSAPRGVTTTVSELSLDCAWLHLSAWLTNSLGGKTLSHTSHSISVAIVGLMGVQLLLVLKSPLPALTLPSLFSPIRLLLLFLEEDRRTCWQYWGYYLWGELSYLGEAGGRSGSRATDYSEGSLLLQETILQQKVWVHRAISVCWQLTENPLWHSSTAFSSSYPTSSENTRFIAATIDSFIDRICLHLFLQNPAFFSSLWKRSRRSPSFSSPAAGLRECRAE